ncbi:AraC family transcriptional regulator [Paenibacillus sp. PK3_47]|uniref:AraC family transcriptional regulator n=1 Tax=Paenibacillus sp. PK3_47 TaxID=2072642 RepID=UPI00201E7450|nr:AraC family transcriptional regulator [Paenibacillus sp. PK3_47]
MEKLLSSGTSTESLSLLDNHILFQQIMLLLLKESANMKEEGDLCSRDELTVQWAEDEQYEAEKAVEQSIAYLHTAYSEQIQIGKLARDAHMSRWQYGNLFKTLTGRTPIEYLTVLRIGISKQMMAGEPVPRLREIAGRVGFQDEYYFSRRFKQTTGCSPSAYRAAGSLPPRMVCLQYLGELLALGIRPVAAERTMLKLLRNQAYGISALDESGLTEALVKLQPELIIYPSFTSPLLARQLRRIAPALELPWQEDVYTRLRRLGIMFGREKAAEDWINRYLSRAFYWRNRLQNIIGPQESASAFAVHHGLYVYTGHHFGHTLYQGMQFAVPEAVRALIEREPGRKWKRISPQQLPEFAGDRIFLAYPTAGQDASEALRLMKIPEWNDLAAVREARAHTIELSLANYNPLTLDAHLEAVGGIIADS